MSTTTMPTPASTNNQGLFEAFNMSESTANPIVSPMEASAMQEAIGKQTVGNITGFGYGFIPGTDADMERLLKSRWAIVEQTTSCPVRVGRSSIQGKGVFATRDILTCSISTLRAYISHHQSKPPSI